MKSLGSISFSLHYILEQFFSAGGMKICPDAEAFQEYFVGQMLGCLSLAGH